MNVCTCGAAACKSSQHYSWCDHLENSSGLDFIKNLIETRDNWTMYYLSDSESNISRVFSYLKGDLSDVFCAVSPATQRVTNATIRYKNGVELNILTYNDLKTKSIDRFHVAFMETSGKSSEALTKMIIPNILTIGGIYEVDPLSFKVM